VNAAHDGILAALDKLDAWPGESGRGNARCPAHEDREPSLHVAQGDGCALLTCHAGCEREDVMRRLGLPMAALYDDWWTRDSEPPEATYDYVDENGKLLYQVVRRPGKKFVQRRSDGANGWLYKLGDTRRVLYRLPRVLAAVAADEDVFVVEGEKDVHAIERAGGVATCNPGGAGKWRAEYADSLRGARVFIVADRDEPGRKHAEQVARALAGIAASVRIVEAAEGKDAHDHLAAGRKLWEFEPTAAPSQEGIAVLRAVLGALPVDIRTAALDPLSPLPGAPFLLAGATAQLAGPEGAGKSQVAQTIAYDVARVGQVLYLAGEITHVEFTTRARKITQAREGEISDIAARLWRERVTFADPDDVLPVIRRYPGAWQAVCGDFALVVLDAVSDAGAALELKFARDNDDWLAFHQLFVKPCQGRVCLLMLDNIGHAEDSRTRALGASAKGHKVDIRLSSKRRDEPLSLIIRCEKVRIVNAPFRRGHSWVAYEDGCKPATPFDSRQRDLERDEPDIIEVIVSALREESPQGMLKLEHVLRVAGIQGRSMSLRADIRAIAADPDCPVRDLGPRGFDLDPDMSIPMSHVPAPTAGDSLSGHAAQPNSLFQPGMSDPMSQSHVHAPPLGGGAGGMDGAGDMNTWRPYLPRGTGEERERYP